MFKLGVCIIFICFFAAIKAETEQKNEETGEENKKIRYLLYSVNPGEGFNLRRDVYIRAANLVRYMNNKGENWVLVLPPWDNIYHWKSSRYLRQEEIQWKEFFDLQNMNLYVPVIELKDFIKKEGLGIDHLLYLQGFSDSFNADEEWVEKIEKKKCLDTLYHKDDDGFYRGYFWGQDNMYAKKFDCVSVQGGVLLLAGLLEKTKTRSVFIARFEEVMHNDYGGFEFNKARRSLVFAEHLRKEADSFRTKNLNSTDEKDKTPYNEDWTKQIPEDSSAIGGAFLGLHMRRGDFVFAHQETVPSIEEIGLEVKKKLEEYKLDTVYISTDGTDKEIEELHSYFKATIHRFPRDSVKQFKDGGIAIIDQWISAHARYFIGTCESTFSYRIHEERDILGFHPDTTYNCVCGKQSPPDQCEQPSRWRVVFS